MLGTSKGVFFGSTGSTGVIFGYFWLADYSQDSSQESLSGVLAFGPVTRGKPIGKSILNIFKAKPSEIPQNQPRLVLRRCVFALVAILGNKINSGLNQRRMLLESFKQLKQTHTCYVYNMHRGKADRYCAI